MKIKNILIGSALLSSLLFAGGDIAEIVIEEPIVETNAWSFEFEPYLMLTNIAGDTKVRKGMEAAAIDVDTGTILDNLDMALMGHFEAHHQSGWGLWIDYGFMDLSNDVEPIAQVNSVETRQGVLEVMGLYRQDVSSGYIEYLAGIRWWDTNIDVNLRNPTLSKEVDWVDGLVGLRYTHILNENWKLRMHGDIGAGGSDITYGASAGFIYTINDLLDIDVKYKATWVDYEDGSVAILPQNNDYFLYDTVTHGLILGLNFKF